MYSILIAPCTHIGPCHVLIYIALITSYNQIRLKSDVLNSDYNWYSTEFTPCTQIRSSLVP